MLIRNAEKYFNSHPHKEDDLPRKDNARIIFHISTHILTRRMTAPAVSACVSVLYFNSHPHKEDDDAVNAFYEHFLISTHILTRRMTI